jgi:copper(I)-binding protein
VFSGFLATTLKAGETLYFPTYQECEQGAHQWIEIPVAGQSPHALKSPAPGVKLLPAANKQAAPAYKLGALEIEAPWARATPGGAQVAAGYVRITNKGTAPDTLVGGSFALARGVEVHEMTSADGVMKMRRLQSGLEIAGGQSVDLKPGGYHLMFTGLREALKDGRTIKGTLEFAKAGKVEVEFQIAPIGAQAGGGGHGHH